MSYLNGICVFFTVKPWMNSVLFDFDVGFKDRHRWFFTLDYDWFTHNDVNRRRKDWCWYLMRHSITIVIRWKWWCNIPADLKALSQKSSGNDIKTICEILLFHLNCWVWLDVICCRYNTTNNHNVTRQQHRWKAFHTKNNDGKIKILAPPTKFYSLYKNKTSFKLAHHYVDLLVAARFSRDKVVREKVIARKASERGKKTQKLCFKSFIFCFVFSSFLRNSRKKKVHELCTK